jgi:CTP:molybdopterin cytidylyltransferase MocA
VGVGCAALELVINPDLVILAAGRARRYGGLKPLAPVGVHGEAVLDLVGSDALAAGFSSIVVVISPETGPQIQAHIKENWTSDAPVAFAIQDRPLGTVHALLAADHVLHHDAPFAVANADDLYGRRAMVTVAEHLRTSADHALAAYRLRNAVVGDQPVTRGVCEVVDGSLTAIVERRGVRHTKDGFVVDDRLTPAVLDPNTRVSMNLWGFQPAMWGIFTRTMAGAQASEQSEVLLPTTVGAHLDDPDVVVRALSVDDECVGVTHPEDLELVQNAVRGQVERGERPEHAFA